MIQHNLSQDVVLTITGLDAWVDVPFGPKVFVNIAKLSAELVAFNIELMDPNEEEPELVTADTMRILCLPTWAALQTSDDDGLATIVPLPAAFSEGTLGEMREAIAGQHDLAESAWR